jgi:glutamyl-Q tRNA(Asp) synthetase
VRLRVMDLPTVTVADRLQGSYHQNLATDVGDFVLRRADGVYAYHLATVLDDADQGVTHVVRGADLLPSTPRQVALQWLLNLPTPVYAHLPVVTVAGQKLSKQTLAQPLQPSLAPQQTRAALAFLDLHPPAELASLPDLLAWAIAHFDLERLPCVRSRPCSDTAVSGVSQPSSQP